MSEFDKLLELTEQSLANEATGREALKTLLDAFGGWPQIAKLMKTEFDALDQGHSARIKLLLMLANAALRFGDTRVGTGNLEQDQKQLALLLKELGEAE